MTVSEIIAVECEREDVSEGQILGKSRDPLLVLVRSRIASRLRHEMGWSLPRIGRKLKRHHTSVLHMLRTLPEKKDTEQHRIEIAKKVVDAAYRTGYRGGEIRGIVVEELGLMVGRSPSNIRSIIAGTTYSRIRRPWLCCLDRD